MEKTNKKSRKKITSLLVLLAVILLCVAVVLGMGGFTYAKYISSKTVSSTTANVAKWGWQVGLDSDQWFSDAYGAVDGYTNSVAIDYSTTDATVSVKAAAVTGETTKGYSDVVAPGTEGSLTFNIAGSAEVRSKITVAVTDKSEGATTAETIQLKWTENNTEKTYEPIKWTLTKKTNSTDTSYSDVYYTKGNDGYSIATSGSDKVENVGYEVLAGVLNSMTDEDVAPGEAYDYAGYYKLTWAWAFQTEKTEAETDEDGNVTTAATYYDLEDTILGAIMAAGTDTFTTLGPDSETITVSTTSGTTTATVGSTSYTATTSLTFGLKITVEQIQGTAASSNDDDNSNA